MFIPITPINGIDVIALKGAISENIINDLGPLEVEVDMDKQRIDEIFAQLCIGYCEYSHVEGCPLSSGKYAHIKQLLFNAVIEEIIGEVEIAEWHYFVQNPSLAHRPDEVGIKNRNDLRARQRSKARKLFGIDQLNSEEKDVEKHE